MEIEEIKIHAVRMLNARVSVGVACILRPLPYSTQNDESAQVSLLREELRKKESVSLCPLVLLLCYIPAFQESVQLEKKQKSLSEQLEAKSEQAPHKLIGQLSMGTMLVWSTEHMPSL